jgi:signal transduction histidine kinase/ligand-binding sensor domain-containing protein/DNA-binding response OmpR family regulator
MGRYIKIIFLLAAFSIFVKAQVKNIQFEYLTAENGLSANTVFSIIQDTRGFLWAGTYDGLNKYDGYNFKVYKNNPDNVSSLSDNRVRVLCEDNNKNIWIGTWGGGLNKFNFETEQFCRFINDPGNPNSISDNSIIALCNDKNGILWIGTVEGGLNRYDPQTQKFISFKNDPLDSNSLSNNSIYSIFEDSKGILWIGTGKGGLNRFDPETKKFKSYKYDPDDENSISDNWVLSIYEDRSGNLWVGTFYGGLNKFNRSTNKFTRFTHEPGNPNSLSDFCVWTIYEDHDGLLFIGTYSGGLNILQNDNKFLRIRKNNKRSGDLNDESILSICEDKSGVLWFGTWYGGINKFDKSKQKFITYTHEDNNPNSLSDNGVNSIYKEKSGVLWIGTTAGGLNKIDPKNNTVTHYKYNPEDPNSISSNSIYSICEDKEGNLWIATEGGGLNRFNRKTNKFKHYKHNPEDPYSLRNNRISKVYCDSFGDLWIGVAEGGYDKYDRLNDNFVHYRLNKNQENNINDFLFYSIHEDYTGNLWIGTYGGGLHLYRRETHDFINFRNDPANPLSLSNDVISSILMDKNGSLWIGTNGGGLNKLLNDKSGFVHFREKDGLSSDMIYGILEDQSGNLWISTGKGISKFNVEHQTFRNYDMKDGLQSTEFNQWSYFKGTDGKMYFGGADGLTVFQPESITDNPVIPEIVITGFELLHKPVTVGYDSIWERIILAKTISETEIIVLNHDDNIISFEFAALDFHNPSKNGYRYILEGFDNEWNYTDANRRFVTYTNLDPGKYIFRVKGSNNDGKWNEAGTSITLIINHPWWATWWSYTLYIIIFVSFLYGLRKYDLNRLNWKNLVKLDELKLKEKEETERIKSHFFANISHEFRTPLTLILGLVQKWKEKTGLTETEKPAAHRIDGKNGFSHEEMHKDLNIVERNAHQLLRLVNQLLDLSKLEAGKLKLQVSKGNIVSFVRGIVMSFESLAEKKDINIKLDAKENNIELYFDRDKIAKVLTNLLSNAFKFTGERGEITICINPPDLETAQKKFVRIIVKDTGIGISDEELPKLFDRFYQVDSSQTREYEGTGLGLALTKEIIELHHGKISVKSRLGEGSDFIVDLPVGKEHLKEYQIFDGDQFENIIKRSTGEGIKDLNEFILKDSLSYIDISEEAGPKIKERSPDDKEIDKTIILVVEDNADVREYIRDSICDSYEVEEAVNGEQGLRKAEHIIPDLIISDIMMPKMDGYELTRRIRGDEKTSHIPIILLTAKSEQESKLEGLETGADDYLTKPFDIKELKIRIKNLIAVRRNLQNKFKGGKIVVKKDEKKLSFLDEKFLAKALEVVEKHLPEEEFSIEEFSSEVGMSRTQLHRKLKALTGKSASLYLRSVRLTKAKSMIEEKRGNISEIAYSVGFSSPQYFTRCFKEEYGHTPKGHD